MILDMFENRERYFSLHNGFKEAFGFIEECMKSKPAPGKYIIKDSQIYALVQHYESTPAENVNWEGHRKYIDIQFVLTGKEIIEWTNIKAVSPDAVYQEEKDFLHCGNIKGMSCTMSQGSFVILYPEDIHKPHCIWDTKCEVDKIVVKVAL